MTDLMINAWLVAGRYIDNDHMDGDWWWMLVMLAFWAAVAVLIVWLVRRGGPSVYHHETPDEILRRRLADGSITVEEFESRRAALRSEAGE